MKYAMSLILVLSIVGCEYKPQRFTLTVVCSDEQHDTIVNYMAECEASSKRCTQNAQELFCKAVYLRNPNYDPELDQD